MNTNFAVKVHIVFSDMSEQILLSNGKEFSFSCSDVESNIEDRVSAMLMKTFPECSVPYQYITTCIDSEDKNSIGIWFIATPLHSLHAKIGEWVKISSCTHIGIPTKVFDMVQRWTRLESKIV